MAGDVSTDHADLKRFEPPLFPVMAMVGGVALDLIWPLPAVPHEVGLALGAVAVVIAVATLAWCIRTMSAAGVDVDPDTSTTAIVDSGPYARSRNPIYFAVIVLAVGVALLVNSGWGLALAAAAAAVLHFRVVGREEAYLSAKFGDEYRAYQSRVRRWV